MTKVENREDRPRSDRNLPTGPEDAHRKRFRKSPNPSMSLQVREKTFEKVGGLDDHIQTLKEMIIYPLVYRELFQAHGIEAPRGVLFHGPPGTGKTLVAGAVAAECTKSTNRRVAFYMRKGADCLNKYVGESEKHLQNLFTQAQNTRPSIIFFDEIDGLVPTRSECHEQVHASVVSTLLALMDGLDSKSEVFVIGATNRIDMIDPALRRPGRFDRELYFPLPPLGSRFQIFKIHTQNWWCPPDSEFLLRMASECPGYCGADIRSLCSQAVMESFRRNYPQVCDTTRKTPVDCRNVQVKKEDFWAAKEKMVPASQRVFATHSRPLTPELEPLLKTTLDSCLDFVQKFCPFKFIHRNAPGLTKNKSITCPRVLVARRGDRGHVPHLASALLHAFDHLPVTVVDLQTIADRTGSGSFTQKIKQATQSMPGILFFPDIGAWWELIDETGRMVLLSSLETLDSSSTTQLFLVATSNTLEYEDLPADVQKIFPKNRVLSVPGPKTEERHEFFARLLLQKTSLNETKYGADEQKNRRTSRRQKGLTVEFPGIENKPKLGSYYRKHVPEERTKNRKRTAERDADGESKNLKMENWSKEWEERERWTERRGEMADLVQLCVRVTSNASTESLIKLYEQLEIVLLRFGPTWDRSYLLQELEREITFFNPS